MSARARKSRCFWPPESVIEPGPPLLAEPELFEQPRAVHAAAVQRGPQVHGLLDGDALLELRGLELDADAVLQRVDVADRVQAEHHDRPAVGPPQPFHALQRRGLAGAVGPDEPEDLAGFHLEGHFVDGHRRAVGLANAGNVDDR
jgi:hypothetical protein